MSSPVVTLFDDVGDAHLYKKVSARLPDFLAEYPPKEGYRIETEVTDSLSLQKGRLALLREAVAGGKRPTELGLPGLEEATVMVCIRRLKSPEGHTIAEGSAAKAIVQYKDYEILETAALQRLMALLGFGGEVFDQDEASDFADQGLNAQTPERTGPARPPTVVERADRGAAPDPMPEVPDDARGAPDGDEVPPALRRQVLNLAQRMGVQAPKVASIDDAKAALKTLSEHQRAQRAEAG